MLLQQYIPILNHSHLQQYIPILKSYDNYSIVIMVTKKTGASGGQNGGPAKKLKREEDNLSNLSKPIRKAVEEIMQKYHG